MAIAPETAIDLFFDEKLGGAQLLRSLASFDHWLAPAGIQAGGPTLLYPTIDGCHHLFMFTGTGLYDVCREAMGPAGLGDHYLDLTGDSLWLNLDPEATTVSINPYSPRAIHYKREQFPLLRKWAEIISVERALDNVLSTDRGFETIKTFAGYYFGFETSSGNKFMALAPDNKRRKLAAIFTAEDAAEAFQAGREPRSVEMVSVGGEKLFKSLKSMPLDGIVFNCCGPATPCAFSIAFADKVLERG
jgi:hypothetical protein